MNNFSYCSFVSIHYIICECGDTFPTEKLLNEHLENEHKNPNVPKYEYQCITCGKIFTTEKACVIHQQVHTKSVNRESRIQSQSKKRYYTSKNIVCEVCGKRYASQAALRYHQRVHTGERPYHCPMCPKTFTMPLFLQVNINMQKRMHITNELNNIGYNIVQICNETGLTIHIRTHTGEKPYECPSCPKAFSNKAALLRHDRVHTGVKPYECPQCGKAFTQSNSMKLHVKTVHLKMPAPYKSKNRKAKIAARQANRIANLIVNVLPVNDRIQEGPESAEEDTGVHRRGTQIKVEPQGEVYQTYQDMPSDVYNTSGVKVEITEVPMYGEEDMEDSEIVYEEVYEMED